MSELKSAFSHTFNEPGFEARIAWGVSRREFAQNVRRLFDDLKKKGGAFALPLAASMGSAACLLAGIDCKGCPGLCCTRTAQTVALFSSEASKLGITGVPDSAGKIPLALPCRFLKKGQCSIYDERPYACRLYPVQAGGSGQGPSGQELIAGLDSFCPEAWRLGQRVYMASYDMARGVKRLQELDQT